VLLMVPLLVDPMVLLMVPLLVDPMVLLMVPPLVDPMVLLKVLLSPGKRLLQCPPSAPRRREWLMAVVAFRAWRATPPTTLPP